MKKTFATVLLTIMLIGQPNALSATPKVGSNCTKLGQIQKSGKALIVCDVIKGKRVWRNADSFEKSEYEDKKRAEAIKAEYNRVVNSNLGKRCITGTTCKVGNTGPGGGIVFYDEGSRQPWGRYLELAPNGWSGTSEDPTASWCDITDSLGAFGKEIGTGKSNTDLMETACSSGASVLARSYSGGGKSDWFLPSEGESNEMCKFAKNQYTGDPRVKCVTYSVRDESVSTTIRSGFTLKRYWSSTENNGVIDFIAFKYDFSSSGGTDFKSSLAAVRPIRAF